MKNKDNKSLKGILWTVVSIFVIMLFFMVAGIRLLRKLKVRSKLPSVDRFDEDKVKDMVIGKDNWIWNYGRKRGNLVGARKKYIMNSVVVVILGIGVFSAIRGYMQHRTNAYYHKSLSISDVHVVKATKASAVQPSKVEIKL